MEASGMTNATRPRPRTS
ncbi:hypothetical protein RSAG8_03798, partial [Rhizoctonia solani AG-8 WAC10335]